MLMKPRKPNWLPQSQCEDHYILRLIFFIQCSFSLVVQVIFSIFPHEVSRVSNKLPAFPFLITRGICCIGPIVPHDVCFGKYALRMETTLDQHKPREACATGCDRKYNVANCMYLCTCHVDSVSTGRGNIPCDRDEQLSGRHDPD